MNPPLPKGFEEGDFCVGPKTEDQKALIAGIRDEPFDQVRRNVYADWLTEHGEDEEAARQVGWIAACRNLYRFTRQCDEDRYEYLDKKYAVDWCNRDDWKALDDEGRNAAAEASVETEWLTYYIGRWLNGIEGGGLHFSTDWAADTLHGEGENEKDWKKNATKARTEFAKCLEIVSGRRVDVAKVKKVGVGCSC